MAWRGSWEAVCTGATCRPAAHHRVTWVPASPPPPHHTHTHTHTPPSPPPPHRHQGCQQQCVLPGVAAAGFHGCSCGLHLGAPPCMQGCSRCCCDNSKGSMLLLLCVLSIQTHILSAKQGLPECCATGPGYAVNAHLALALMCLPACVYRQPHDFPAHKWSRSSSTWKPVVLRVTAFGLEALQPQSGTHH
jgi:hypothetical protein